jgi:hypothetical protein
MERLMGDNEKESHEGWPSKACNNWYYVPGIRAGGLSLREELQVAFVLKRNFPSIQEVFFLFLRELSARFLS